MRLRALAAAAVLVLAAACDQATDNPLAAQTRTCADDDADAADRIAACTTLAETAEVDDATRAAALGNRGAAKREGGDVTGALRDFEAALRLEEENAPALLGRGSILLASGQLDTAEPLLHRAVAQDQTGEAEQLLGRIELERGNYDEAITHFEAALQRDNRMALAMAGRARAKQHNDDLEGAQADYDAAVRLDGNLAEARAGRCWMDLTAERELGRARNDADVAVASDPQFVEAQMCRGILQLRGGEWANARVSFDAVLDVEPGNPMALFGRGVARRRSGDNAGTGDMNLARDFDDDIGGRFDDLGVDTY